MTSDLTRALARLARTFRGATAHPDEYNCDCHWGGAEELALLKAPDVELNPDLLRRTWHAWDWDYPDLVLRRILPQLAAALAAGEIDVDGSDFGIGPTIGRCGWQEWPAEEATAVRDFLDAWWVHALTDPDAPQPAHDVLAVCTEALDALGPWLDVWAGLAHPLANQRLAEAVEQWEFDLLWGEQLPWATWSDEDARREDLGAWLVRHAPGRLRAHGAPDAHAVRLLGLPAGPARWDDPHFPWPRKSGEPPTVP
ncbi:hypothetical protein [Asanoa iriomotensis]|uniref:DUF4253 domain-containing protein n=1 Tax=Asanoa iriomotensis TaxID=234613 RepID=A0ABQ4BWV8_9ACTN|nr:hypothetical protein [Asanoa iriomotensis]GIF55021.1 hypothetical protein Air01nite_11160 [Asanoa iriomotensis]